jgi:cyanophycinase
MERTYSHGVQLIRDFVNNEFMLLANVLLKLERTDLGAGAAALSTPMIYQGRNDAGYRKDEIHITTGLQFLGDVAIDTHFVARGRIVRMAQIIATNPGCIGLGLEEDTAVLVTNGRELEVVGNGLVVVVDGHACRGNTIHEVQPGEVFSIRDLRVHLLASGQRYTLPE